MAYTDYLDTVQKIFIGYYQRPVDPGGLVYWAQRLDASAGNLQEIIEAFANSAESQALYGAITSTNISTVVNSIYQALFGRDAEAGGLNYYVNGFNTGKFTAATIMLNILNGAQGEDLLTVNNKVTAANRFTERIDPELDGLNLLATYNASDIPYARDFLKNITADQSTCPTEIQVILYVQQHIANPGDPITTSQSLMTEAAQKSEINTGFDPVASISKNEVMALDSDFHWDKTNLTYSFNTSIPGEYFQYTEKSLTASWRPLSSAEKGVVREAFANISNFTALKFTEVSSNGDIRFNSIDILDDRSFAFYPGNNPGYLGDVFLSNELQDDPEYSSFTQGGYGRLTIYHEIGHTMGLKHPFEGSVTLPSTLDDMAHTIMSYTYPAYLTVKFTVTGTRPYAEYVQNAIPNRFSLYDVEALQAIDGPNTSYATGNNVHTFSGKEPHYLTIWDAGGHDKIDASAATGDCQVNLNPGTLSSIDIYPTEQQITDAIAYLRSQGITGYDSWVRDVFNQIDGDGKLYKGFNNLSIVTGTIIEDVSTGFGNDIIIDNYVDNTIDTGAGNDVIELGRGGFDTGIGGDGTDTVKLNVLRKDIQMADLNDNEIVLVGTNFAALLIGVEKLQFSDGTTLLIA